MKKDGKTSDNQDFVLDQDVGLVIFCSLKNLQILQKSQKILGDETFKTAPKPFHQIYTKFSVLQDRKIPSLLALMSEKTEEAYQNLLEKIDEKCQIFLSKNFEPSFIISDYETGFIAAVKKLMPQVDHLGCYFHYTQAVLRKIRNFGLIIAYRNNRPFHLLCRKIFSLGFLPIDHVITNFDNL